MGFEVERPTIFEGSDVNGDVTLAIAVSSSLSSRRRRERNRELVCFVEE